MGESKPLPILIVAMAFISQVTIAAAQSNDFCSALKAVGADVRGGFTHVRGTAMGPPEFDNDDGKIETTFRVSRTLSGSDRCDIKWQMSDDVRPKGWGYYECSFALNPTNVETASEIAIEISECTGVKARNRS